MTTTTNQPYTHTHTHTHTHSSEEKIAGNMSFKKFIIFKIQKTYVCISLYSILDMAVF
jgi:hypothetical protein